MKKALILVDIQNDFCPGGALAVSHGDEVVAVANRLVKELRPDLVIATQDWHPADHGSFASNNPGASIGQLGELDGLPQVFWPDHCVQNTSGASFHSGLDVAGIDYVVRKGTHKNVDSYSAFSDNGRRRHTDLRAILLANEIYGLYVLGLATDYCVKFTALDARKHSFSVKVVENGCRAVNLNPKDGEKALDEMRTAGCEVVNL